MASESGRRRRICERGRLREPGDFFEGGFEGFKDGVGIALVGDEKCSGTECETG